MRNRITLIIFSLILAIFLSVFYHTSNIHGLCNGSSCIDIGIFDMEYGFPFTYRMQSGVFEDGTKGSKYNSLASDVTINTIAISGLLLTTYEILSRWIKRRNK